MKDISTIEKRLALALQSSGIGIYDWDLKKNTIIWDDKMHHIFGLSKSSTIDRNEFFLNCLVNEDKDRVAQQTQEALSPSNPVTSYELEYRIRKKKDIVHIKTLGFIDRDENGQVLKITGSCVDLTAERLAQQESKEKANQLSIFVKHSPVAVAMFDLKMNYMAVSDRWISDYKLPDEDLTGKNHYDVFPELPDEFREAHKRSLNGEVLKSDGDPFVRPNGTVQWVRWECRPWYGHNKQIGGIILYTEDITDQRSASEELKEAHRFNESILQTNPDIIYLYDLVEQKNIYINDGIEKLLGYTKKDIEELGNNIIAALMHPDDLLKYIKHTIPKYEYAKDNEPIVIESRIRSKAGLWRRLRSKELIYRRNENGRPIQIFGTAEDITEYKLLDERNEKLIKRHETMLASMQDGYILADVAGKILDVNDSYCQMVGYSREELLSRNIIDMRAKPNSEVIEERIRRMHEEKSIKFATEHLHRRGDTINLEVSMTLMEHGEEPLVAAFVRNITNEVRSKIALAESKERLELIFNGSTDNLTFFEKRNGNFILTEMNEVCAATMRFAGLDDKACYGQTAEVFLESLHSSHLLPLFHQAEKTGELIPFETYLDGEQGRRYFKSSVIPISDKKIGFGVLVVSAEVTNERRALEELKASQEELDLIFNNTEEMLVLVAYNGTEWVISRGNNAALSSAEKLALNPDKIYGLPLMKVAELLGEKGTDLDHYMERYNQVRRTGKKVTYQVERKNDKNKFTLFAHVNLIPIIDEQGECNQILAVTRDLTKERQAQANEQKIQEELSLIYNNTEEMLGLVEWRRGNWIYTTVNESAVRVLEKMGISREQFIGSTAGDVGKLFFGLKDESLDKWIANYDKARKTKEKVVFETERDNVQSGGKIYSFISFIPLIENDTCNRLLFVARNITAERQAQENLRKSQEELSVIFNSTQEVIGLMKHTGDTWVHSVINQSGIKLLKKYGVDTGQFLGAPVGTVGNSALNFDSDTRDMIGRKLKRIFHDHIKTDLELNFRDPKTNEDTYFDITLTPILDNTKTCSRILYVLHDVSEVKRAASKIAESESRLAMVFENTSDGMSLYATNKGKIELISSNQSSILSKLMISDKSSDKRNTKDVFKEAGQEELYQTILDTIAQKKPLKIERTISFQNGESHFLIRFVPIMDKKNVAYVLMVSTEITDLRNAQIEIQQSEERFARLAASTTEGICITQDGVIMDVNPQLAAMLKVPQEKLEGSQLLDFISTENTPETIKRIQNLAPGSHEVILNRSDNSAFFAEISSESIIWKGHKAGVLAIYDITARHETEQALADSLSEIKALKDELQRENIYLRQEIEQSHSYEEMVYGSPEFNTMLQNLDQVADTDATVLIQGETGTGKELVARAVHNKSRRHDKPLIKVNCAAIPKDLIESELFGHTKGSFTGATQDKPGKFELADGGTLFLDEVGELPISLQPKLLRALQEREIEKIGSTKVKKVDVRVIAATNRELKKQVDAGHFREDLYFRLEVFPIYVPSLRERTGDVRLLVEHFVNKFNKKYHKHIKYISDSAMKNLEAYSWPGNVRELENVIERSVILTKDQSLNIPNLDQGGKMVSIKEKERTLNESQRDYILKVLKQCDWKIEGKNGAAKILDLRPSTLRDKMSKLGITRPA